MPISTLSQSFIFCPSFHRFNNAYEQTTIDTQHVAIIIAKKGLAR